MAFEAFAKKINDNYKKMAKDELYVTEHEDIYKTYLQAFPAGSDPMFRARTEHDCSTCKQFIRRLGILVGFVGGGVKSVWDVEGLEYPYDVVAARMSNVVHEAKIKTIFRTKERVYGNERNLDTSLREWKHFYGRVEDRHYSLDAATKCGEAEGTYQVLSRGLKSLRISDFDDVISLIDSNGLYRGEEHRNALVGFRDLLRKYDGSDNFVWANIDNRAARFRSTAIGTMLADLAAGKPLEEAVRIFESMVAPQNYKRPSAIITPRMVDNALVKLEELGLTGAVHRRYARLSDVSVNNVLFADRSVKPKMKDSGGLRELLGVEAQKEFDTKKAQPITINDFVTSVLPGTTSIKLLLDKSLVSNFVSLTGGDGPERLFKWNNNFAWSYDGEVADSVKQRVKAAGGNVNSLMRVSLSWSNYDDLDLHCFIPRGGHVFFGNKAGILDVDMNAAGRRDSRTPVENLAFMSVKDGTYKISVNNYMKVESIDVGFNLEVEFGGVLHQFCYSKAVRNKETIEALQIIVKGGVVTEIRAGDGVIGGDVPVTKWGLQTGKLVPVAIFLTSPNHWDGQTAGAKHWFFMLEGCKNPDSVRGIYNEFLRPELEQHRKVFEILGAKTKCAYSDDQISGVGFTSARGHSVTVVIDNGRAYKIGF